MAQHLKTMSVLDRISGKFQNIILETHFFRGDETVLVRKEAIRDIMNFLKSDPELDFNILMDLTAVDYFWMFKKPRFEVVYHLYSLVKKHRIRVKIGVDDREPIVDSMVSIWPAADWYEREVWDMFGIQFAAHPNLKRILMYEEFVGHPLRKDYPVNKRQPLIGPKN